MTSKHVQKLRTFRPDPDEYDTAEALLEARGRSVAAYLRACLRWLDYAPDTALNVLSPHWPAPRRIGRPRSKHSRGNTHSTADAPTAGQADRPKT